MVNDIVSILFYIIKCWKKIIHILLNQNIIRKIIRADSSLTNQIYIIICYNNIVFICAN